MALYSSTNYIATHLLYFQSKRCKKKDLMKLWSLTVAIKLPYFLLVEQVQNISLCSSQFAVVLCRETCSEKEQTPLDCEDSTGLTPSPQSPTSPLVLVTCSVIESINRKLLGSFNFTYLHNCHEKPYVLVYCSDPNNECSAVSRG